MPTLTLTPPIHKSGAYPIIIESGAIKKLPSILKKIDADRVYVIYDGRLEKTAKEIGALVSAERLFPVRSGEQSKNLNELENLAKGLLQSGATKYSVLIAVGGGMITDLGGFLAGIFMRGIRVIHVPTSMLAMVDAAIGGKTAVEVGSVKNILGVIHHPSAVIEDTDFLGDLPDTLLREGMVEAVKEAAMLDASAFGWLEKAMPLILKRDEKNLIRCIFEAVRLKSAVVEADDRDVHLRHFLNFGHTVGHALEAVSGFRISHGQAVSVGMCAEMKIAKTRGSDRVIALLKSMDMPVKIPAEYDPVELWKLIQSDKKKKAGVVRLFVPLSIGEGAMIPLEKKSFMQLF
ncbi:hypothetical protein A3A67_00055 [Candidatus Peribacteria bacterium RIFCSPLOWO2_01_FULL_51_18]|nr:MAG: hypothetical protein A3C52_00190 [Candidatus Peribacteria bacterium RIFCSPHIGHO2_02_FULL_51_15]OGJ65290.1 MAG: hypothetical protein A3A67_00055 [Candidatus Peribacteria bacterium RIFCSPLOWO2_01_FULL_51_18]